MGSVQFKLPIGAKRQVTIPKQCMELLSLEEGGELLLEIAGDHAILLPVVSVARRDLPEELRMKYESRRGQKSTDIPLSEFLRELGEGDELNTQKEAGAKCPEVGKVYLGRVTRVMQFGAFVELLPGIEGLIHISEFGAQSLKDAREMLSVGDGLTVKVLAVDGSRIKLGRRELVDKRKAELAQEVVSHPETDSIEVRKL